MDYYTVFKKKKTLHIHNLDEPEDIMGKRNKQMIEGGKKFLFSRLCYLWLSNMNSGAEDHWGPIPALLLVSCRPLT